MTSFRIRPKFIAWTDKSKDEIIAKLEKKLNFPNQEHPCRVQIYPHRIKLQIPNDQQHYWSPELEVSIEESDGGTVLRGRYGPHQNVWTLFTLLYLATVILIIFIAIIGFSRMSLGLPSQILWVLPILIGFGLFLYIVSQLGQKLGAEETFTLHHFLEELLEQKINIQ